MNADLQSLLSIFVDKLPTIAAFIPLPYAGVAGSVIAAVAKHYLGNADAPLSEVVAAVKADPAKAVEALKPLDDHLAAVSAAAVAGSVTVPNAELPAATVAVTDAVKFQTDLREVTLGVVDDQGRAILSIYLTPDALQQLKMEA